MHELSLAQSICEAVADHLTADQRVVTVVVEWGPLSGVVPEALEHCFAIVAQSLGLEGAKLELRTLRAHASCRACGDQFEIDEMWAACPGCGHAPVTVVGGNEFRLKEIEVEDV